MVVIDEMDLRRKIEHVHYILKTEFPDSADVKRLRECMGHTPVEIAGGCGGRCGGAYHKTFGLLMLAPEPVAGLMKASYRDASD